MEKELKKFLIVEGIIFVFMISATLTSIVSDATFRKLFNSISKQTTWFFGLTAGMVFSFYLTRMKEKSNFFEFSRGKNFPLFLAVLIVIVFIGDLITGISKNFFLGSYRFFHIILAQWLVLFYLWFKLGYKQKPLFYYIAANEAIIAICLVILLAAK